MTATSPKTVTVSSKGWVVIPAMLRKKIGLKPGMMVAVREVEGEIVLTPQAEDSVDGLYGKLAGGESLTEALLSSRAEDGNREKAKVRSR